LEKGLSGIQSSSFSDAGTTARVFGTFLTWQQEKAVPVFTIATCNSVENLPPELLRKGRFDEIFFVDLPSDAERKEIFSIHITKRDREPESFDLDMLSNVSSGFSGAEIEQAVISGMFDAFDDETDLQTEHILEAIYDTVPLSVTMTEGIEHLRKWASTRAIPASEVVTVTSENVRNVEI
jgi:SpoVK/Ycf46/Vps4 family AAA+-type ATPase